MDEFEKQFGVEPICRVLPIAQSTYHQRSLEARKPERTPARSRTDAALRVEIARVKEEKVARIRDRVRQSRDETRTDMVDHVERSHAPKSPHSTSGQPRPTNCGKQAMQA